MVNDQIYNFILTLKKNQKKSIVYIYKVGSYLPSSTSSASKHLFGGPRPASASIVFACPSYIDLNSSKSFKVNDQK